MSKRPGGIFFVLVGVALIGCAVVGWRLFRPHPPAVAAVTSDEVAPAPAARPAGVPPSASAPPVEVPRFTTTKTSDGVSAPAASPHPMLRRGTLAVPAETPALAAGLSVVDAAIGAGKWTDETRAKLREVLPTLDKVQRVAVLERLAVALRSRKLQLGTSDQEAL